MGLFDKKFCDVCGEKIGLLGNRKLSDGNLCKNCAAKLSPWFSERRASTVDEIKNQLAYREENADAVAAFHTTRSFGENYILCLDEDAQKFMIKRSSREENPDVLDYSLVTGCDLDIDESKTEIEREYKDKDGHTQRESYNPPRYRYSYDYNIIIRVNHPFFDEMKFRLNSESVELEDRVTVAKPAGRPGGPIRNIGAAVSAVTTNRDPNSTVEGRTYQKMADEIIEALMAARQQTRDAAAQKTAVTCPYCGATTVPDAGGCCEYCGGAVNG